MPRNHPPLAAQVRALFEAHPLASKVVFVPRVQIGQAIEQAVFRRRGKEGGGGSGAASAWGGLSCLLPRHYAKRLATRRVLSSGRQELQPAARRFLAARLADELGAEAFAELPGPAHFAGSVAQAIGTLRGEGTEAKRVLGAAGKSAASPALGVIARCYAAYEDALEQENLYDDADVLRWGIGALAGEAPAETKETVFAVVGDAELSTLEAEFLCALQSAGQAFYRIGEHRCIGEHCPPQDVPEGLAAARFQKAPLPEGVQAEELQAEEVQVEGTQPESGAGGEGARTVCRAVGAGNEVRAAFQDVLASGAAFDEVEIALAQRRPYQSIVADVAEQAGIDVTFSTGRPALHTRTGQALRGLYAWIQEDFDPAHLIGLLRSGLVCTGRASGRPGAEEEWSGPELATWLAGRRYEPGRAGYAKAFAIAVEDLEGEVARLEEKGLGAEREKSRLRRAHVAREIITGLLGLIPQGLSSAGAMAQMSQRFLERFGPIEAPDHVPEEERPEEERSVEDAARRVLYQKLGNLRDMPVAYEAPAGRLAGMFQEALERQYVRSERPRAGAVHVVPLERAAFGGRPRLYVLGLGSEAFSSPETEGALLQELEGELEGPNEGQGISSNGTAEPSSRGSADRSTGSSADKTQWLARRALRRHRGPTHLFASVYDVESGEERFPAAFFLEAEDRLRAEGASGHEAPLACFMPDTGGCAAEGGHLLIDERTCWLASHADGRLQRFEESEASAPTGREAACERYGWLEHAAAARAACCSEEYTCHDGFLERGPFPGLDFTAGAYDGPPLSAGRLETFAQTPYLYFLKYVLGIRPLDEPALEADGWLGPLRRGSILHDTFERFMKSREEDGPVRTGEEETLQEALHESLAELKRRLAPPSGHVEAAALRRLKADARVFLHAEALHAEAFHAEELHGGAAEGEDSGAMPWAHELGFGYGPRRAQEGDLGDAEIAFEGDLKVSLRGRIDRIDQLKNGKLAVWDYKTGSAKGHDESEPLSGGARLQWALYAYVLSALTGKEVASSGYFFTSTKEMGSRLSSSPARYRDEVGEIITQLGAMARAGCFPMNPRARYLAGWKWRGYEALFTDLEERSDELKPKAENYPDDKPIPLFLQDT